MSILNDQKLNISTIFKQLIPAQPCVLCGSMSRYCLWCEACNAALPYLNAPHCPVCALPTAQGELCGHCLKKPPAFTRTIAVFNYQFPVDRLIQAMKYHQMLALSQIFAEKLMQRIDKSYGRDKSTEYEEYYARSPLSGSLPQAGERDKDSLREPHITLPDYIIPMPLHPAKLRRRGFNQAQLIAAPLAKSLGIPLLAHACRRLRDTPSQTSLPWKERSRNVRGAFSCDVDLTGKHVALVDDVLTTGASMDALASAVKKRGADQISAWVVARTIRDS